ncbi:transporter substrate-binding domain-containing protein [Desulfobacter sp.]|uniref:transporter substrate-binding domain-containing protein n=1 Tax=Desulfobacter sp. TaxID=2294 RepID=UPI003D0BA4C2
MKKFKQYIVWAVTALVLSAGAAMAADRPVKVAIEGNFPPFNYVDTKGTPLGFEVDLVKEICRRIGRSCEFTVVDWDGIIPALLARKIDVVAASMSITEERKRAVAFTHKYYAETGNFAVVKGSEIKISPDGLREKRVGVQRATIWGNYVKNVFPDATIVYYDNVDLGCLDLIARRIDAMLGQSLYMNDWLKKPNAKDLVIAGAPVNDSRYIGEGIGFAMRKSDTELQTRFNKALDAMLADGTYQKLADRYFDFDIYGSKE